MNLLARSFAWLAIFAIAAEPCPAAPEVVRSEASPEIADPTFQLLHDDHVRSDLALSPRQVDSLDQLLRNNNQLLMSVRDATGSGTREEVKPLLDALREQVDKDLNHDQQVRLRQIVLQAQGLGALYRGDIARELRLSPNQRARLREHAERFHAAVEGVKARSAELSTEGREGELLAAQEAHRDQVFRELTQQQFALLGKLFGEKFDLTRVRSSAAFAPELEDVSEWIHSEPSSLQAFRGRVVVVHFFAFGCANCINNYPWYREWQAQFPGKDVVIVGIHTPETTAEHDRNRLCTSLDKHGLTFPVAVDNERTNWQLWSNNIWPAVYLVDRKGRVRYWWYGELDWQNAGGQHVMRRRIEELVDEPVPSQ